MSVVHPGRWSGGSCGVGRPGATKLPRSSNPTVSSVHGAPQWRDCLLGGQRRALARLLQEADGLGADGVVDVRFDDRRTLPVGFAEEFVLTGTAVRSTGAARPGLPFSSALSASDAVSLLRTGWAPVSLVFGMEICVRHDDRSTNAARNQWVTREITGWTDLVRIARGRARAEARAQAEAAGGQGLVLAGLTHRVYRRACRQVDGVADHIVRATVLGTSVVRVPSTKRPTTTVATVVRTGA